MAGSKTVPVKLPGALHAAGEKAHEAATYSFASPKEHAKIGKELRAAADKHVASLIASGVDLKKAVRQHRQEAARSFGGADIAHSVVARKLEQAMKEPKSIQTGAKGGQFYITSNGQKVYVGKGK